jgi:DNA-binding LacI/PurR family transcriptional regulator
MSDDGRRVTLEHVARAAGVSRATASRALTGSGPASEDVLQRVRAAADELGYVADPVARALAQGGGTRVVVAVTAATEDVVECAYTAQVVGAAARVCHPAGLGVSLRWLPLAGGAGALDDLARDRTVRGLVLVNTTYPLLEALPRQLRGRVASIGTGSPTVPSMDVDVGRALAGVVAHLVARGRRRPVMITGPPWLPCARVPVAAYRAAVLAAGLPVRTVVGGYAPEHGRAGAVEALRRWPDTDALVGSCDDVALGAVATLHRLGLRVPDDVAVTGFDDIPAAEYAGPALTTATHPVARIATAAVRAVLSGARAAEGTLFPSELVLRDSA